MRLRKTEHFCNTTALRSLRPVAIITDEISTQHLIKLMDKLRRRKNYSLIFNISLGYNLVLHDSIKRPWWTRLDDFLILGALPIVEKNHLELLLHEQNVKAIVTLNQPHELLPNFFGTPVSPDVWASRGIFQYIGATDDFSAPSLDTIKSCISFIDTQIAQKKSVYIHCKAGRGRSALIAIAFLLQNHHWELKEAIDFVTSKRQHIKLHAKQLLRLAEFATVVVSLNTKRLT